MRRTTVMLPKELKTKAMNHARKMGISMGQFIREALARSLDQDKYPIEDPLFSDDAVFQGKTPADLAQNHDDYLYGDNP